MRHNRDIVSVITVEPFAPSELDLWLQETLARYIDERISAGDSLAGAQANANASVERFFPNGSPASGQVIGRLVSSRQRIGHLWTGPAADDSERWWVWDVLIYEEFRGRGYGRQAMLLAEGLARTNGASTIGLNVFGHNNVARSLYSALGYQETSVQMRKAL